MPDVNVISFNVRGLRNMVKRRTVFRFMHHYYPTHIVVLQETHSAPRDNAYWQAEWGAPIILSHGPSTSECGVAVLLPRALLSICDVKTLFNDDSGRLIILEFKYRLCKLLLCAVYAPTQSHGQQQVNFLCKVKDELDSLMDGEPNLLLCGDLNMHLSNLDTQNRFRLTQAARDLQTLSKDLNLVDVWRDRYKSKRQYTWRRFNPSQQSRIDYVLASENLLLNNVLKRIEIKPGVQSDHSLVNFELEVHASDKGRGLFRFDNTLLEDEEFVNSARVEMAKATNCQGMYEDVNDLGLKIEMLSSAIRVQSLILVKHRARQRREHEQILMDQIDRWEQEVGRNPTEDNMKEYIALKTKLNQEEEKRGRIAMLRSGARWLELGEKPTRYFLRLNASRKKEKEIHVLQRPDGEYTSKTPYLAIDE